MCNNRLRKQAKRCGYYGDSKSDKTCWCVVVLARDASNGTVWMECSCAGTLSVPCRGGRRSVL